MLKKLRLKAIAWLTTVLCRLHAPYNDQQHAQRLQEIRVFMYEDLPRLLQLDPNDPDQVLDIIEGGRYNLFQLPSGDIPRFDFVCPSLSLYIFVPNITSTDWEEARLRGIPRITWELAQADIQAVEDHVQYINNQSTEVQPARLIVIRWTDAINKLSMLRRFKKVLEWKE